MELVAPMRLKTQTGSSNAFKSSRSALGPPSLFATTSRKTSLAIAREVMLMERHHAKMFLFPPTRS